MRFCNAGPCLAADRSLDETGGRLLRYIKDTQPN